MEAPVADGATWKPCFRGQILEEIDKLVGDGHINYVHAYS